MPHVTPRLPARPIALIGVVALLLAGAVTLRAIITDMALLESMHAAVGEHLDQAELMALVQSGQNNAAFDEAFEHGDELFETEFNALDGVGASVGDGGRFTRVPRADLSGAGQWASHTPSRATGPNAVSCNACHLQLFDDGSGSAVGNVIRDPGHTGNLKKFIQRNTPHVFSLGTVQRVAEEMTGELFALRDAASAQTCASGQAVTVTLVAKGVDFGTLKVSRARTTPCQVALNTSAVVGVNQDLIVRPFQWKGSIASVREFNRGAAHDEIGMQPVETTGDDVDGDGDGVANEFTIGDVTALSVYLAAQPRPTTKMELARLGIIDPLPAEETAAIQAGSQVFDTIGCASCHVRSFTLNDPIFREPSANAAYRDATFPAGQDPIQRGVDFNHPVVFDLTHDQPDNQVKDAHGNVVYRLGSLTTDASGKAVAELFGDMKRHDMGAGLTEQIDEVGSGKTTFMTRNLWGIGSTAPYMHDGRATTLTEAILEHGGEAAASSDRFRALPVGAQQTLVKFLENLVLFKMDEEGVVIPPPSTVQLNSALKLRRVHRH
ncbi:MAG TPA: di-heme oxidoredictase family protein [Vicinamibacterales bacterium]|nr:di-heme oxidoredictase family protein [Vicinamibacterales bacterium]